MYLFVNPDTGKAPRAHQEGISHRSVTRERVVYTGHGAPAPSIPGSSGKQLQRSSAERFPDSPSGWSRGAGWEVAKKIPSRSGEYPSAPPGSRQGGEGTVRSFGMGNY